MLVMGGGRPETPVARLALFQSPTWRLFQYLSLLSLRHHHQQLLRWHHNGSLGTSISSNLQYIRVGLLHPQHGSRTRGQQAGDRSQRRRHPTAIHLHGQQPPNKKALMIGMMMMTGIAMRMSQHPRKLRWASLLIVLWWLCWSCRFKDKSKLETSQDCSNRSSWMAGLVLKFFLVGGGDLIGVKKELGAKEWRARLLGNSSEKVSNR